MDRLLVPEGQTRKHWNYNYLISFFLTISSFVNDNANQVKGVLRKPAGLKNMSHYTPRLSKTCSRILNT